jgi:hypothetical protein
MCCLLQTGFHAGPSGSGSLNGCCEVDDPTVASHSRAARSTCSGSSAVSVHLLSAADSHWPLVAAARKQNPSICGSSSSSQSSSATAAGLEDQIRRVAGRAAALQPELVLVFGRTLTLAGYPPWSLRFSEVYYLGSLARMTRTRLHATLGHYYRTTQRFGA